MSDLGRCCKGIYRNYSLYQCSAKASVERDGKFYCGRHDPVKCKAKSDARHTAFLAEVEVREKQRKKERAAEELLEQLKFAVSWIEDLPRKRASHQLLDVHLDKMRAVIAKAEGTP
jgi:hypothetical protein